MHAGRDLWDHLAQLRAQSKEMGPNTNCKLGLPSPITSRVPLHDHASELGAGGPWLSSRKSIPSDCSSTRQAGSLGDRKLSHSQEHGGQGGLGPHQVHFSLETPGFLCWVTSAFHQCRGANNTSSPSWSHRSSCSADCARAGPWCAPLSGTEPSTVRAPSEAMHRLWW